MSTLQPPAKIFNNIKHYIVCWHTVPIHNLSMFNSIWTPVQRDKQTENLYRQNEKFPQ